MANASNGIIFLADDNEAFRESVREALEDAGYFVLSARDGLETLARLRGFSGRALAIVDLNMPVMSGVELIGSMRRDARTSHIPILVVTASHRSAVIDGVSRVLRKPFKLDKLVHVVRELLP